MNIILEKKLYWNSKKFQDVLIHIQVELNK